MGTQANMISIIVPVYNTEKYLDQCIQSVLAQTYTNWELLLIDDGSSDSSGAICDKYASQDSRIRVLHKDNGGVSSARNLGLDNAKGEWITFVDSDDWLNEQAISTVDIKQKVDIIVSPYIEYEEGVTKQPVTATDALFIKEDERKKFIEQYLHTGLLKCVCGKIYKKSCIGKVRFDTNIRYGEDTLFFLHVAKQIKSIKLNAHPVYYYRKFPLKGKYTRSINDSLYAMTKLFDGYDALVVRSSEFEKDIYCDCKSLCQKFIDITPRLWYHNIQIKSFYNRVRKHVTMEYRIRHFIRRILAYRK